MSGGKFGALYEFFANIDSKLGIWINSNFKSKEIKAFNMPKQDDDADYKAAAAGQSVLALESTAGKFCEVQYRVGSNRGK